MLNISLLSVECLQVTSNLATWFCIVRVKIRHNGTRFHDSPMEKQHTHAHAHTPVSRPRSCYCRYESERGVRQEDIHRRAPPTRRLRLTSETSRAHNHVEKVSWLSVGVGENLSLLFHSDSRGFKKKKRARGGVSGGEERLPPPLAGKLD